MAGAMALSGCATVESVEKAQATADQALSQAQAASAAAKHAQDTADAAGGSAAAAASAAQAAQARADAAYTLAGQGGYTGTVVSTDASTLFDTGKAVLSQEDQDRLMAFAQKLKSENKDVYLEIEGHADKVGSKESNQELGHQRAVAVGRFLYEQGGIPLHRMNVISYGETKPVAPPMKNGNPANRCVVIKVIG
jgi:outer membrane protein OmpA-like peptidoglycan-associated protein